MKLTIKMLERTMDIEVSHRAAAELDRREIPLCLEMELYFSCLIRKRVLVKESMSAEYAVDVNDKLKLGFRPVMTRSCTLEETDENGKPPLTDFPIEKPERYIPHWLKLDYRKGKWQAEFGYHENSAHSRAAMM